MINYWDYSEKERAELASESIEAMLTVELMRNGVLKPVAPNLTPIVSLQTGERRKYYGLKGKSKYGSDESLSVCFETVEQAQKFLELQPLKSDYDYEIGSENGYVTPIGNASIQMMEAYSLEQINTYRSAMKQNKANADRNEKEITRFREASEKADKITSHVWEDWNNCRSRRSELSTISNTFTEYLKMTQNDAAMASGFLAKAFSNTEIAAAIEWFPEAFRAFPVAIMPQPAE